MQVWNLRKGFFFGGGTSWNSDGCAQISIFFSGHGSLLSIYPVILMSNSDARKGENALFLNLLHVSFHTFQDRQGGNYLLPMHSEGQAEVTGTRVIQNINILLEISWAILEIKSS